MHDLPRQRLRDLITTYGPSVIEDPDHCERLLRAICGEYRREFFVLAGALREGVPAALLAAAPDVSRTSFLARLARELQDGLAVTEEAAHWAVEAWAVALGVVDLSDHVSTVTVALDGTGDYRSIGAALRAASSGTRVVIRPGRYEEGLVIDQEVEIIGDGPPAEIIVESINAPCVQVEAEWAVVRGLSLRSYVEWRGSKYYAVEVAQGRFEMEDCDITSDALACVAVHEPSADPVFRRCRVHDGQGFGVSVYDGARATLEECVISGNRYAGVEVRGDARVLLRRCRIRDNAREGIWAYDGGSVTLEDCEVDGNLKAGISAERGSEPVIRGGCIRDPVVAYEPTRVNSWRVILAWAMIGALVVGIIVRAVSGLVVGALVGMLLGAILAGIMSGVLGGQR